MRKRSKIIAERDRQRSRMERIQEQSRLEASALELKSRAAGFSLTVPTKEQIRAIKRKERNLAKIKMFGFRYTEGAISKSQREHYPVPKVKEKPKYEGELLQREQKAMELAKLLHGRVGPVGNKMGDQYLTDLDLADMKKGLLRRRS